MTGLILKLQPRERVLINGTIIENGDRRARFNILTHDAKVLRMKDALHPSEVTSPVRRVAYIAQLAIIGDADPKEAKQQLLNGIESLSQILTDHDSRVQLNKATEAVIADHFYNCMKALRQLLSREDRLLAYHQS